MVRAWYMDNEENDPQLEHHRSPPMFVAQEELREKTGIECLKLNIDTLTTDGVLNKIKKERNYNYENLFKASKECLPNWEESLKEFYREHLHPAEQTRLVLEGSGYIDVRDKSDQWIRVEVRVGDMFIVPSGIYHRFIPDLTNYIKMKRFFSGGSEIVTCYRPADDMTCRQEYLDKPAKGFAATAPPSS